jgi:hypothetical protein
MQNCIVRPGEYPTQRPDAVSFAQFADEFRDSMKISRSPPEALHAKLIVLLSPEQTTADERMISALPVAPTTTARYAAYWR